jgi:hypothetical protein
MSLSHASPLASAVSIDFLTRVGNTIPFLVPVCLWQYLVAAIHRCGVLRVTLSFQLTIIRPQPSPSTASHSATTQWRSEYILGMQKPAKVNGGLLFLRTKCTFVDLHLSGRPQRSDDG